MNGLKRRVHFVGVGGIGMSGLAEILLNLGYPVSGSDLKSSEITERLKTLGLTFFEGHAAHHVGDAGIVVRSAAVDEENVEIVAAKRRGIPVLHRSEMLADLMRLKPNAVAVGGTHGKTTTTSMISAILDHADIGATSIVGGILHRSGTNARWGEGDFLVAEADEHDGSFLHLSPQLAWSPTSTPNTWNITEPWTVSNRHLLTFAIAFLFMGIPLSALTTLTRAPYCRTSPAFASRMV